MKNKVSAMLCVGAGLLTQLPSLSAIAPSNFNRGFLLDQYFTIMDGDWDTGGNQNKLSDWDVDAKAGNVDFDYWTWMKVTDSSTTGRVEMRKPFLPQSSGTIALEFRLQMPAQVDDVVWAVRADRDNSLFEFTTSGTNFGYIDSSGTFIALQPYAANTNYTVHVDLNVPGATGTVYIDGVQRATGSIGRNTRLSQAAQFYIGTPVVGMITDLKMHYVTISKGYKLLERFTNAAVGAVPANWSATTAGGAASVQVANGSNTRDTYSFKLADTSASAACTLGRTITTTSGKLVWDYKFMLPVQVAGMTAQLRSGGTSAVTLTTTATNGLAYLNGSGTAVELWPNYKANVWYMIRVIADPATDTADIWINGKKKGVGVPFNNAVASFTNVLFSTPVAGQGVEWVDDIYAYDFEPLPADYVPAVQPVTKGSINVGVQTFFTGWREGMHVGWDWIYRFPNHDPVLGHYDGGNTEAMDWQLKWMAEAGVTFFLDCWYKNGLGQPLKEPQPEAPAAGGPLHHGYFYAEYSDKVKFAIADYSLANVSAADFSAYLLPYWMEYYFKDDRYYVVPGAHKGYPVVAVGNPEAWLAKTGDSSAMHDSIAALETALIAEGFDGVIVMGVYPNSTQATMDAMFNAGIDYCYAYWGTNNVTTMQTRLNAQKASPSALEPIADAGQGYNGEAWDVVLSGAGYTTLPNFTTMSTWMRDTFCPSLADSFNQHTVLYDNWNEYGEGHFLAPTKLAGFGYLDIIRSTFTSSTVTNQSPTEAQKGRFNTLYTRAWEGRQWGFDSIYMDTEGWTATGTSITQNKGYLEGTFTGTDPALLSRDGYEIDASKFKRIKIRMNNPTTGTAGRVYFITNTDATYNLAKSASFTLGTSTSAYTEYTVDMSGVAGWAGTIRQLRVDPVDVGAASGMTFSIDWIKVVAESGWEFDGATTEGWAVKVQITGLALSAGNLEGTIAGIDPSIWSADNLGVDLSVYKRIKVRMKNSTTGTAAKMYFITNADTTYNEAKAVSVSIVPSDPNYSEYIFDFRANAGWTGTLRRLRFDMVDAGATTGNFSIDYIRLIQ